jgi:hypothetical protein
MWASGPGRAWTRLGWGNGPLRDDGSQVGQEFRLIDAMLAAGVGHGVEAGDRAADAMHPVVQEGSDRHRPAAHDVVDELRGFNGHHGLRADGSIDMTPSSQFSAVPLCATSTRRKVPSAWVFV